MPLTAPQNLVVTQGDFYGELPLQWDDLAGTDSYNVYRSEDDETYEFIANVPASEYLDTFIPLHSFEYFYKVAGVDAEGEGDLSLPDSATTLSPGASKPRPPNDIVVVSSNGRNNLIWPWGADDIRSWYVLRSTTQGEGHTEIAHIGTPSHEDTAVVNGTTYYYVIIANNLLDSNPSDEVSGTPFESEGVAIFIRRRRR